MRKVLTFKFANIQTCPLWLSLLFQQPETADCSFVLEMFEGDPEQLNSVQHPCWLMIGSVVILQYPIYRGVSFFFAFNIHAPHFGLFGLCYVKDMHSICSRRLVSGNHLAAAFRTPNASPSKCKHAESRMASTALGLANLSAQWIQFKLIVPKPNQNKWFVSLSLSILYIYMIHTILIWVDTVQVATVFTENRRNTFYQPLCAPPSRFAGRDDRRDAPEPSCEIAMSSKRCHH